MKNKIVLVGCGNVGISYVYALINQKVTIDEIVIIDPNEKNTKGEIIDFDHCLPFVNSNVKIYKGDYSECKNASMVVITAGARQNSGRG